MPIDTGEPPCEDLDDADCDGLDDDQEAALGTDPLDPDSDDDGLSDWDEIALYDTDPTLADTDGDGLEDGQEADPTLATDPLLEDTDGDGFSDGAEVDASTDPLDADSHPTPPVWINTPVSCTTMDKVAAYHFEDDKYYFAPFSIGGSRYGYECHCRVHVDDPTLTPVTGITVWTPTVAHDGTNWVTSSATPPNPRPLGVHVVGPSWLPTATAAGPILDGEVAIATKNFDSDLDGVADTTADEWIAFNSDERTDDTAFSFTTATPVDVSGDYDIYISMVNPEGENIGSCSSFTQEVSTGLAVHFSVDYYPHIAFVPSPSPLWCRPGTGGATHFRLMDTGHGGSRAVARDGAAGFLGANLSRVEVTDWRGAEQLVLHSPNGARITLDRAHPTLDLAATVPLQGISWQASRASPGVFQDPDVRLSHSCPSAAVNPGPAPGASFPLSWGEADQLLQQVTGGWSLAQAGVPVRHPEWPVFRVRRVHAGDNAATGAAGGDRLILEAEGAGSLLELPLVFVEGEWRFMQWGPHGRLSGTVSETPQGLQLRLAPGRLDTAMGAIDLLPVEITLGAPHAQP